MANSTRTAFVPLAGSEFSSAFPSSRKVYVEDRGDHVAATSPWGNRLQCYAPGPRFGDMVLGLPYVEFTVRRGVVEGIARFYREMLDAPSRVEGDAAIVTVGPAQVLRFVETRGTVAAYDGHHVQIYLADFSGPYRRLLERGLVSRETDEHEYRFIDIVDLATGAVQFEIEHEVRSMRHPLYGRPLVNRNPAQSNQGYVPGRDAFR